MSISKTEIPLKSLQLLSKCDNITLLNEFLLGTPKFSQILAVKTTSGRYKTKLVKIINKKLIFYSIKTQKPTKYLDFENLFQLKYRKSKPETNQFSFYISLSKEDNYLNFASNDHQILTEFLKVLKNNCVLEGFSQEYHLLNVLGSGHFAKVYLAKKNSTNQLFAAKIIKKDENFKQNKEYIMKEIKILKFLPPNPYIIELFEVYESPEQIIMVFEYMPGEDLYKKIKNSKKLTENQAFSYFSQMIKGMLFLHNFGICHRDLKPDNILFLDDNKLKIADFSLADTFHHKMKGVCGTPGYMAPEIFSQDNYDEKIDVYSLGVVLYTMLTGTSLFGGQKVEEIIKKNKIGKLNKTKNSNSLSPEAQKLLAQMLQKSSSKRISLKQVCLSKWFISQYRWSHYGNITLLNSTNEEDVDHRGSNQFSENLSPHLKLKHKNSKMNLNNNKTNNQLSFTSEDNVVDEGKININNYNLKPKFINHCEYGINEYLNQSKEFILSEKNIECSIAKQMCLLNVNSFEFLIKPESPISFSISSPNNLDSFTISCADNEILNQKFDQNSSLFNYLKDDRLENNIEKKQNEKKKTEEKGQEQEIQSNDLTLRTKRAGDIDICQMMDKLRKNNCNWLKF